MINKSTMDTMLELDGHGCIEFNFFTGNYEYAFQREKLLEVLFSRCFDINDDYSLTAVPGKMTVDGADISSDDCFGEYLERYQSGTAIFEENIYFKALKRLSKYGMLWESAIWSDEVIDFASLEDVPFSDECMETIRSMDLVSEILYLQDVDVDIEGFKKAFPYLQSELSDYFCYDPLNETGTLNIIAYESEVIGKLFGFHTSDKELLRLRDILRSGFLGFSSSVSDGKFYMYVVYGQIEDQFATIEDMPDSFIGQIALLEQCIEKYVANRPQVVECTKEENVCRAA